jgi:hypothetical protein
MRHWDFIATKSLILGEPRKLFMDLKGTFAKLDIKDSSQNRSLYAAALKRAIGYDYMTFSYVRTGRWTSQQMYTETLENMQKQVNAVTGINFANIEACMAALGETHEHGTPWKPA